MHTRGEYYWTTWAIVFGSAGSSWGACSQRPLCPAGTLRSCEDGDLSLPPVHISSLALPTERDTFCGQFQQLPLLTLRFLQPLTVLCGTVQGSHAGVEGEKVPETELLIQSGECYAQLGTHKGPGWVRAPWGINCGWQCVNRGENSSAGAGLNSPFHTLCCHFPSPRKNPSHLWLMSRIIRLCGLICLLLSISRHAPVCVFTCSVCLKRVIRDQVSAAAQKAPLFQELMKIVASTCKICGIYEMKSRWCFKRSGLSIRPPISSFSPPQCLSVFDSVFGCVWQC